MKLKVYIAGKVSKDSVFGTHDWRDGFCSELSQKTGFEIINLDPTKSSEDFELAQNNPRLIFGRNCYLQNLADLTVVYLSDDISVGGSQEMLIAKYLKKPLLGIARKEGKFNKSKKESMGKIWDNYLDPYVATSCDKVVEDIDQLANYLKSDYRNSQGKTKDLGIIDESIQHYRNEFLKKDSYANSIR